MKKSLATLLMAAAVTLSASPVFAAAVEAAEGAATGGSTKIWFFIVVAAAAALCMTVAAVGCGFAQSNAIRTAVEGIARNPSASGTILTTMLIGIAMIESLAIYVLVIALILLFANPFTHLL